MSRGLSLENGKVIIRDGDWRPYDSRHPEISRENLEKLEKSKQETAGMKPRDLKCPVCGYTIARVYGDQQGHANLKCRKCKFDGVINLAYFRRVKGKIRRDYPEERNREDW